MNQIDVKIPELPPCEVSKERCTKLGPLSGKRGEHSEIGPRIGRGVWRDDDNATHRVDLPNVFRVATPRKSRHIIGGAGEGTDLTDRAATAGNGERPTVLALPH